MRRKTFSRAFGTVFVVLVALAATPGTSFAEPDKRRAKVDDAVSNQVDLDNKAEVDILLRGPDTNKLFRKYAKHGLELPLIDAVSTTIRAQDLDKLEADPEISFVLADPPAAPQGKIDYSQLMTVYPLADRANVAWDTSFDGAGVGIAVIDSGVAPTADFAGRLVRVSNSQNANSLNDEVGHGSLVAGIAGGRSPDGRFIGIAPRATIYALNVNSPRGVRTSDVIDALQWVFDNARRYNIRVVNLSLGQTVESSYRTNILDLAVERVWAAGITVVVSAGNGGPNSVDFAPAHDPLVISVGSTDTQGTVDTTDDTITQFTSTGNTRDGFAKPELLAPGRLIASVLPAGTTLDQQAPARNRVAPGYATISGTSFSAPQVAGAAAILHQRHPDWSPDQVKAALVGASTPISGSNLRTLDIAAAANLTNPGRANQGVPALVCAPGSSCQTAGTIASSWNSASWNSASWNSASWNSASWNSNSWNSASWNGFSWNSNSWNSFSWNSVSWNGLDGGPTAVALRSLTASRSAHAVLLRWRTGSETDLLGFNVYRSQRGKLVRVNGSLIQSVFAGTATGRAYTWRDLRAGRGKVTYRLQAVALDGTRSWLGFASTKP